MILHTVVSASLLLPQEPAPQGRAVPAGGGYLGLSMGPDGRERVQSLCSTDPADYLNPEFAPGAAYRPHSPHKVRTRFY